MVTANDLLTMNLTGEIVEGQGSAPFEAWLHTAIMKAKPEVHAITRIHARVANRFSVTDRILEPVHNHGSFFSGGVPVFNTPDLISNRKLGEAVVETLGNKPAVLLRGNGQVTVGKSIPEAVMMAIYLEEAAEILYGALPIRMNVPLKASESAALELAALPRTWW